MSEAAAFTAGGIARGARRIILLAILVIPFGVAFGAAAVGAGIPPAAAVLMSATVFAGASQFAALDLVAPAAGASLVSLALVVLAVNARHLVLGATIAPWAMTAPPPQRLLTLAFLSDANYVDARDAHRGGERDFGVLLGGGLMLWASWIAGTAAGAAFAAGAGALEAYGADVAMASFFAAAIAPACRRRDAAGAVALAALVAVGASSVLPAGWNIVAAAVAGGAVGALRA